MAKQKHQNVFQAITHTHELEEFTPTAEPTPTDHPPGTWERVVELARRVERGEHLWHDHDKNDYAGVKSIDMRGQVGGRK